MNEGEKSDRIPSTSCDGSWCQQVEKKTQQWCFRFDLWYVLKYFIENNEGRSMSRVLFYFLCSNRSRKHESSALINFYMYLGAFFKANWKFSTIFCYSAISVNFSGQQNGSATGAFVSSRSEPISLSTLEQDCFIIPVRSLERFLPAGIPVINY